MTATPHRLLAAGLALALSSTPAIAAKAKAPLPNDLRPALKKLAATRAADGPQDVTVLADGSRLVLTLAGGKPVSWTLAPAKGTPEAAINYDRAPNPKDKHQCALLVARSAFTVEYVIDCAFVPPLPGR